MTIVYCTDKNPNKKGIGGKAKNLFELQALGAKVPAWLVIPEDFLVHQIPQNTVESAWKEAWQNLKLHSEQVQEIAEFFGSDFNKKSFAVRSSAIDEDGEQFSFAGQFESYLHVSAHNLEEAVIKVWQSASSDRVLKYRQENNLPLQFGIAVIIQEMVPAELSGVAFGADPRTGDRSTKVISALYGLGEGLVSGDLDADNYYVSAEGTKEEIAQKEFQYVQNSNGDGLQKVEVPKEQQEQACLSAAIQKEVANLLEGLEDHFGKAQDIEFAIYNGELFLLQCRPITSLDKQGDYILWDNSNIIESYPGITTPLTFSFILKMYDQVYRQFVQLMGVREEEVNRHADVFANTLGLVRGRVYYNLLNWYKMLAMLPGYSINAENMERMMGVKERFELGAEFRMSKGLARFRIFTMVLKMLIIQLQLAQKRRKFLSHLNKVMEQYQKLKFNQLSAQEIIKHYKNFEQSLLLKWKAPLINDFFAMIWFGMLEKQSRKYCPGESNLHNDLLCGSQDIISVEPIHRSMDLARAIADEPELKELFESKDPKEIWRLLEQGAHPGIKAGIEAYIQKFGDRCVGELKLESRSYTQYPHLFIKVLKSYVQQGVSAPHGKEGIEDEIRERAELKIAQALKAKPLRRWWFKIVLKMTRDLVSNRENLRFERTRGFGMVRNMFNALGEQWQQAGALKEPRDIFYLQLEEILDHSNGDLPPVYKSIIEARKAEFEGYHRQKPPQERFYTYGYEFKDQYIYSTEKLEAAEVDLKGIGCCPGRVQAKVRIVLDPHSVDSLNGDILVTSSTDPGWVTLFPTASAIIVERGSLLSHSAIVSREMGIPCIVSVKGLLRTLEDGEEVLMDGSTGQIKRLKNE